MRDSIAHAVLIPFAFGLATAALATPALPDPAGRLEFEGTGRFTTTAGSAEEPANFAGSVYDGGPCDTGAREDTYSITVRRGSVIGQGEIVYEVPGRTS
jgi:hypothetical protein